MDRRGTLCVLGAAVLWGTTGTAQALAPAGAGPLAIGAMRLVVGGAALLAVLLFRRSPAGAPSIFRLPAGPALLAAGCMAAYQVLFFAGVARTGVAVGTVVGIGSAPVLAGALGWLFRGERPGRRWAAATLLAVTGCALLTLAGEQLDVDPLGMLLAVGAGGAYATFSLASKGLLESRPVEQVMAVVFGLGALMLSPLLLTQPTGWLASPRGLGVVAWLGVAATALAYTLFGQGLRLTPLAAAVTLTLAEPLTAGTLGVLLLGEQLSLAAAAGIALIFGGLVVLSIPIKRALSAASPVP
jgi:DME family drug/metabolite transporter